MKHVHRDLGNGRARPDHPLTPSSARREAHAKLNERTNQNIERINRILSSLFLRPGDTGAQPNEKTTFRTIMNRIEA